MEFSIIKLMALVFFCKNINNYYLYLSKIEFTRFFYLLLAKTPSSFYLTQIKINAFIYEKKNKYI